MYRRNMKLGTEEEEEIITSGSQSARIGRLTMEDELASSCSSSTSTNTTISLGGRAIDRCNPIIRDATRLGKVVQQLNTTGTTSTKPPYENSKKNMINIQKGNKTTTENRPEISKAAATATGNYEISPGDSSRYLLTTNSTKSFLYSHRFDPLLAMVEQSPSSSSPAAASNHQVVVLRVSLHCKGCERKMRKHISKMKGVTSFNIDFAAKKLTVAGCDTAISTS